MSECSGSCGSCASGADCQEKLQQRMAGIGRKLLVMSGKGGVGKSTVAAALAVALARSGRKVGLLDVDFHGPSQPTLFGVGHKRMEGGANGLLPLEVAGVKLVSIGLLLEDGDQAVIWRGPAKMGVLKELLEETDWGTLDDLILDFPPGTGDEVLSACQLIPGAKEAIVVTTPQEVSLADCRKCLDFCAKVEVPVAGVVENMSGFVCPDCGKRHELFSAGGGIKLAEKYGLKLLAQIPLEPGFMADCDHGDIAGGLERSQPVAAAMRDVIAGIRK